MQTTIFSVTDRTRDFEFALAARSDFATGPAESAPLETVLEPGWAPYCLDVERAEMVFAHVSPDVDLSEQAFIPHAQYRMADRIATAPFAGLDGLTARLPLPSNLVWIFSIGRTGTTLASHILNGSPSVWSLSEPEPFSFRGLRAASAAGHSPADIITHGVKLLFACVPAGRETLAIKLQSQSLFNADWFHAATPGARFIFMYRDAIGWIASFHQFHQGIGAPDRLEGDWLNIGWSMISADTPRQVLADRFRLDPESVEVEDLLSSAWILHLEAYRKAVAAGVPLKPIHYDALKSSPREATSNLFALAGLPPEGVDAGLKAFEKDSQEGTVIARDATRRRLSPEQISNARALIGAQGAQYDPDIVL